MFGTANSTVITANETTNISSTNSSTLDDDADILVCIPKPFVYFASTIGAVAKLFAAFLNFSIVYTFFKVRRLITPFTIHVLNLILIDLSSVVTVGPLMIYREFDLTFLHHAPFCEWYQYFTWEITALIILQHTVICADRWLAIYAPMLYREKKIYHGIVATFFIIVWFHAWFLPMLVQDATWYSTVGAETGRLCDAPRPRPYLFVAITMIFWIPEFFVYLSYPLIVRHIWSRRKKTAAVKGALATRSRLSTSAMATEFSRTNATAADMASHFDHTTSTGTNHVERVERRRKRRDEHSANMLVMVMLVIQFSLWIPITFLLMFKGIRPELPCTTDLFGFAYILGIIILLADPFVYLAFLPDLRREVLKLFPVLDFDRWVCRRVRVEIDPNED